jgi:hypothetical protein
MVIMAEILIIRSMIVKSGSLLSWKWHRLLRYFC